MSHATTTGAIGDVLSFIGTCDATSLKDAINQNPGIVNYKGWAGLTPLHKACIRGDLFVVRALIESGADPLITNDHDELPVMFAAKTGNLRVLHHILTRGCHSQQLQHTAYMLSSRDKSGRGLLHHAAMCGKILVFQYLVEVHGLSVTDRDNNLQTPLHLCCQHGNDAAAEFILKYLSHSDVMLDKDKDGNNCFHLSCIHGSAELVWLLLSHYRGNLRIINIFNITNNSGQTGFDICITASSHRHKLLVQYLRTWFRSSTFRGLSVRLKLSAAVRALLPTLIFLSSSLVSQLLVSRAQWLVSLPVTLLTAAVLARFEQHRLSHPSGAPNPVYAGLFCGGVAWTTGVYLWKMYPLGPPRGTLTPPPIVCVPLLCLLYVTLVTLVRRDPGTIRYSSITTTSSSIEEGCGRGGVVSGLVQVADGRADLTRYCTYCKWVIPERSRHCRLCSACLRGVDHHCLYLMKCVAANNHRLFLALVAQLIAAHCTFLTLLYQYASRMHSSTSTVGVAGGSADWIVWTLKYDGALTTLALCNGFSLLWECKLLVEQVSNISQGQTTLLRPLAAPDQQQEARSKVSCQQRARNLYRFFCTSAHRRASGSSERGNEDI